MSRSKRTRGKRPKATISPRGRVVWGVFMAAMTSVGGLFWVLQGGPAPRLDGLAVGDRVRVSGEYEWNAQGGLLHWTHHDPAGRHQAGYIEWKGRRYQ